MTAEGRRAGSRYWEIDAARGVAIVMMVIYHLVWDLVSYDIAPSIDLYGPLWQTFQRATASLFLLLVGVSLQVRAERLRARGQVRQIWSRQLRRALMVFGAGLLVTAVTFFAVPEGVVVFGILHLIGVSMVLAYPFMALGMWNALPGLALLAAGGPIANTLVDTPWLVWLGLRYPGFATVDYFPLIPWFGVVLLGLALGNVAYAGGRRLPLPDLADTPPVRLLSWLGRHALPIYLIHQPLLVALLVALGLLPLSRLG
ncbi:MAG: DUF1624 domain-containing protein [Chloroflexi bacterium]|nr:DUF1624 domain-containing protein [Chloroflexota bacterium]